jgi:hypothetical protein
MRYKHQPSSGARRFAAVSSAVVAWSFTGLVLSIAFVWGALLRCDEACDGDGWRRTYGAWQWHGVTALGGVAFLCGAALVYYVSKGLRRQAAAAAALGLAAALTIATAMSPEWAFHLDRRTAADVLIVAVGIAAPLLSIALTKPRAEASGP